MTDITASAKSLSPFAGIDRAPALVVGAAIVFGALAIGRLVDAPQALLFLIGGLMGAALYHGSFGFTGGWRRMVVERRGRGMRAQLLMIGVTAIAFFPLLALGNVGGQPPVKPKEPW
ncbi:MAG: hypothetical protein F9K43_24035 [Bauldia sp.]|nr:MAG: hypothetical protein F9K43_24035 [Bauldia sp.]